MTYLSPDQIRLMLCLIIPMLMILCFVVWQFYTDERNRRKFYQEKYYEEPRVNHYPEKKKPWILRFIVFWIAFFITLTLLSCEKETAITLPSCYNCELMINGKLTNIDTCMDADAFIKKYSQRLELICREVE